MIEQFKRIFFQGIGNMHLLFFQHQPNYHANLQLLLIKFAIFIFGITLLLGCVSQPPEKTILKPHTTSTKSKHLTVSNQSNKPSPTAEQVNSRAKNCLGLAMYWEARGEGDRGMLAVGSVVLNRVESQHFPNTVSDMVYEGGETPPCQFSWWCDGKNDHPRNRMQWQSALNVADELLSNQLHDPTKGALFFHSTSVRSSFHRSRQRTAHIGNHIFYR